MADVDKARASVREAQEHLTSAQSALDEALTALDDVQPSDEILVQAGANLQDEIDKAPSGATLILEAGVYDGAVVISKPLMIRSMLVGEGPVGRDQAVWLTSNKPETVKITGPHVDLSNIGIKNSNPQYQLVSIDGGSDVSMERVTGLGDEALGLHRGVMMHGERITISNCYFDDIFAIGRDSCVLGAWDGGRDILIEDCFLRGGAETIMFGGADSQSAERIPQNIEISHCTLTKKQGWLNSDISIKNSLELKCAKNLHVHDCIFEYAGTSGGQGGFLIVLTVRNQGGKAPWSTIQNVTIERCHGRFAAGCVSFLGLDNNYPSEYMNNVSISNCKFTDINPQIYKGNGRCMQFDASPRNVTLEHLTIEGQNLAALGYFPPAGKTPKVEPIGLVMKDWKYPQTRYGWKIDAGGMDIPPLSKSLKAYMPDMIYDITASDPGAIGTPSLPR